MADTDAVKDTVESLKHLTAAKIWETVLKNDPVTELNEKQIYRYWAEVNSGEWRLDDDQVKSALKVLEKYEDLSVEIIPITAEDGISALAFSFREILDEFGVDIEEIAMDSTWKTNALGYELYGIVGEANGQALPLAFAFASSTDGTAAEGAKDRMLQHVPGHISMRCPLSDTDVGG
ncbi:hypothetical protein DFH09DRAFT_1200157 [Mycena vulgaris]|nr:hypothetical protein DFH09DRAFT_1200157 [Mycena vulgaris]